MCHPLDELSLSACKILLLLFFFNPVLLEQRPRRTEKNPDAVEGVMLACFE